MPPQRSPFTRRDGSNERRRQPCILGASQQLSCRSRQNGIHLTYCRRHRPLNCVHGVSMTPWPVIPLAGGAVGCLMGVFGVGGSSVATPVLSLLGVPPLVAVASPLVATIPGATIAAVPYVRSGDARPKAAAWSLLGAVPATIVGALLSRLVGGPALLVASGVVLVDVGARVLLPIEDAAREAGTRRRMNRPLLVA